MKYTNIVEGTFLERPNRFVAMVDINGEVCKCHVKNTGRCKELLIPNESKVYLEDFGENTNRKTRYDLVTVEKGKRLINMDSQAPNKLVEEKIVDKTLFSDVTLWKREKVYGNSRFDFYVERKVGEDIVKTFIEVKGVTLEEENIARFPDAPTERGVKHIQELMKAIEDGYEAMLIFVVQMEGIKWVEPNDKTHPQFGQTLAEAIEKGVKVKAMCCEVKPSEVKITGETVVQVSIKPLV